MKAKKNIYFLLFLVILIWSLIGYKVFKTLKSPEDFIVFDKMPYLKNNSIEKRERFSINLIHRDPFLGKIGLKKRNTKPSKSRRKIVDSLGVVPFPKVVYKGFITPKTINKSKVFLVVINGVQHFLSKGDKKEKVVLLYGNSKHIKVSFQGVEKVIFLE